MIVEDINEFDMERVDLLVNLIQRDKILINRIIAALATKSTHFPYHLIHYAI